MIFALAYMNAPDLQALLKLHLGEAFQDACSAAFDAKRLSEPDVDLYTLRDEAGALLGMAALKTLADGTGEVKSVRTHPDHLRKGIAHKLMDGIEAEARRRGMTHLRLETHPTPAYAAARILYERRGYAYCGPFAGYEDTANSVFMECVL
jgi:putative acetyltransferase